MQPPGKNDPVEKFCGQGSSPPLPRAPPRANNNDDRIAVASAANYRLEKSASCRETLMSYDNLYRADQEPKVTENVKSRHLATRCYKGELTLQQNGYNILPAKLRQNSASNLLTKKKIDGKVQQKINETKDKIQIVQNKTKKEEKLMNKTLQKNKRIFVSGSSGSSGSSNSPTGNLNRGHETTSKKVRTLKKKRPFDVTNIEITAMNNKIIKVSFTMHVALNDDCVRLEYVPQLDARAGQLAPIPGLFTFAVVRTAELYKSEKGDWRHLVALGAMMPIPCENLLAKTEMRLPRAAWRTGLQVAGKYVTLHSLISPA